MGGLEEEDLTIMEKRKESAEMDGETRCSDRFCLCILPLPIFDIVGIAAGVLRMNWIKYLFSAALGKTLKFLIGGGGRILCTSIIVTVYKRSRSCYY